ncbi:MAG: hypothetical protein ABR881_12180 [Candidatus Sulfotelmatobacter sp.]|jgi:hypothetical protein
MLVVMAFLSHWDRFGMVKQSGTMASILVLGLIPATAQAPKAHRAPPKPTELVIRQYEKLVARGALLTPEGWKRASQLYERSDPYPRNGEIQVVSTGGLIAENWMHGDEAEVETKWDDFFGTIDGALRYKPPAYAGSILMGRLFAMVRTHQQVGTDERDKTTGITGPEEWKIKGPQSLRFATIPAAIKYVQEIRDQSKDPVIRENAKETIAALKRLPQGCGSASAC